MPVNQNLYLRASIINSIRAFFVSRGFLEVETPLRIPANAPEEHINPFRSDSWYLHTSPELCMKRLLSQGYEKIFQICRCWRDEERGDRHLPEFTMLEWYRANADYYDLMNDCEELLKWIATTSGLNAENLRYCGQRLDLLASPELITVREAFSSFSVKDMDTAIADGEFDEILVSQIEPSLPYAKPVFLTDYPAEMAALARLKKDDASVAERFELYLAGLELANGFSELSDPIEQLERFKAVNLLRNERDLPTLPIPEPFLRDLENMPPSAGIALGVDRLVMIFADMECIDDVVAFAPEAL